MNKPSKAERNLWITDRKGAVCSTMLNYDEAMRRFHYWLNHHDEPRRETALSLLCDMLQRERRNLYFEED